MEAGDGVEPVVTENSEGVLIAERSPRRFHTMSPQLRSRWLRGDSLTYQVAKRAMDIAGAIVGLVLLAPIVLIAALAIRLDSPGPVFFRQLRVGLHRRPFELWKLRGMYVDARERYPELYRYDLCRAEPHEWRFKCEGDPRVTRVGRMLRAFAIDELPNLINVLKGEMSLVGPRPEIPELVEYYTSRDAEVLSVKPGVTSPAKVLGRDHLSFRQNLELELDYVRNRSLWLDIKTIFQTVGVVFAMRNVFDGRDLMGRNGSGKPSGNGRPGEVSPSR